MTLNLVLNLNLMISDQCISVTDLKKNANKYIKSLDKHKIIFVNNKPVAVLLDIKQFEEGWTDIELDRPMHMKDFYDLMDQS